MPWLSVSPASFSTTPLTSARINVIVSPRLLPSDPAKYPLFAVRALTRDFSPQCLMRYRCVVQIIDVHHSDLNGPLSLPVTVVYPSSKDGGNSNPQKSWGEPFSLGIVTGIAVMLAVVGVVYIVCLRFCPNRCSRGSRTVPSTVASAQTSRSGGKRGGAGFEKLPHDEDRNNDDSTLSRTRSESVGDVELGRVQRNVPGSSGPALANPRTLSPPVNKTVSPPPPSSARKPLPTLIPNPVLRAEEFDSQWTTLPTW